MHTGKVSLHQKVNYDEAFAQLTPQTLEGWYSLASPIRSQDDVKFWWTVAVIRTGLFIRIPEGRVSMPAPSEIPHTLSMYKTLISVTPSTATANQPSSRPGVLERSTAIDSLSGHRLSVPSYRFNQPVSVHNPRASAGLSPVPCPSDRSRRWIVPDVPNHPNHPTLLSPVVPERPIQPPTRLIKRDFHERFDAPLGCFTTFYSSRQTQTALSHNPWCVVHHPFQ